MTGLNPDPPPAAAALADATYVGYRAPGLSAAVRLPSGEQALLGGDERAGLRLAAVVLADHLGYTPCPDLIEAFADDWPPRRGEFMWPAAAIDGWLSASAATRAAATCSGASLDGALARVRRILRPPAHHPMSATTLSTRGAV